MKPILIDSFGMLLSKFLKGEYVGDEPHYIYYFAAMREAVFSPECDYLKSKTNPHGRATEEQLNALLSLLKVAENDGRCNWRQDRYIRHKSEKNRFRLMLSKLRELGANDIPEWIESNKDGFNDAYWNIPAMREFIGDRIDYMFKV
jgi:hypothetical protein